MTRSTALTADPTPRRDQAKAVRRRRPRERPAGPPTVRHTNPDGLATAPRWWRELTVIAAFYIVYTAIRDVRGTRPVSVAVAYHHAQWIIGLERALGVFHEAPIQHIALHEHFVVEVLDVWYGSTHFVVTAAVLVLLFFHYPARYRIWRNALAGATTLALAGFAFFPLMPPRLLPPGYGFVDTLQVIGGFWAFNSGPMPDLSNQFAAMPSLHVAWALWCGAALIPVMRRWWSKTAVACYAMITLVGVIVTGNHYIVDAVVGALIVAVGYKASSLAVTLTRRRESAAANSGALSDRAPGVP
ncbi:MAG: phosphatase PAP2 family protein [Actinomycetota bacterium]|nr:phosphatase PAP2 family protein [Actinomycetota bacterium]